MIWSLLVYSTRSDNERVDASSSTRSRNNDDQQLLENSKIDTKGTKRASLSLEGVT
jgi:hypothetical protein